MSRHCSKFITARLKLFSADQGGKSHPIKSGYRPNHVFEYVDGQALSFYIGEINTQGDEWISPGEEKIVEVQFLFVPQIEKYLVVGNKWWIHEASKLVGEAEIISLNSKVAE